MDPLFEKFLKEVGSLKKLFELAPNKSSEAYVGQRPDEEDIEELKKVLERLIEVQCHLESYREKPIQGHEKEVSRWLAFFRQLPRYMSERVDVYWSAYYEEIRKHMGNIHDLLIDIDTKYKLGQHRWD